MVRHSLMIVLSLSLLATLVVVGGCTSLEVTTSRSGGWTTFTSNYWLTDKNVVTRVTQDNRGTIWVGTFRGLIRFNGSSWEIYPGFTRNTSIFCIARDKQGNLWFGTYDDGVFEYTGEEWQNFTPGNTGNGLPGPLIGTIFVDNQDNVWLAAVGNAGGRTGPIDYGVTRYDGANWTSFLDGTRVQTIFQDNDGDMWFGTNVGVILNDGSHWQTLTTEDGLADNYITAICQDNQGNMWFATWGNGVSRYDGKNWRTFTHEDGLGSDAIYCMLKDSQGNLWFGGGHTTGGYCGISCFNGTQWQNFDPWQGEEGEYDYLVSSIFEDNEDNLWFATSYGPVRYSPD
jgi:ligand-binding sensor domain-containing protein